MTDKWLNRPSRDLQAGEIREMFNRAARMTDVISLGIGEPDMPTPGPIIEAGTRALAKGLTHYTANAGLIEFRQAVAGSPLAARPDYKPEREIMSTVGGMGGLYLGLAVTLNPGDEVIIQDPAWLNYLSQIKFLGGRPVPAKTTGSTSFRLTAEAIEEAISPRTKALIINTPCNPTGAVLTREDLHEIARLAIRHDLLVFSDEVYSTLVYDEHRHVSIAGLEGMRDRTLVINSFSKSFAMTGWRVGFACGPAPLIEKMTRLQENVNACVPVMAQHAGIYALQRMNLAEAMRKTYLERRNYMTEELNRLAPLGCEAPPGSFYIFLDARGLRLPSRILARDILEKVGVVTIPGSSFGQCGEGYLRLSFANSMENLSLALARLESYLKLTLSR